MSKRILILLGIMLLSAVLAVSAFLIWDVPKLKGQFEGVSTWAELLQEVKNWDEDKWRFCGEQDLADFSELSLEAKDLVFEIRQAAETKISFYLENRCWAAEKGTWEIRQDGQRLTLKQKESGKNCKLLLTCPKPELLQAHMKLENANLSLQDSLKSLGLEAKNAMVELRGAESYPLQLDMENGMLLLAFKNYQAEIGLDSSDAVIDCFGEQLIQSGQGARHYTKGNGRDAIQIKMENGIIHLEDGR